MRPVTFSLIISLLVWFLSSSQVHAVQSSLDISKTLAVVSVKGGSVDQSVYSQFDKLVPELKKISKDHIIKLECRYSGRREREQDIVNAYNIAARIERYLRVRHKLDLDVWVAIDIKTKSDKSSPALTIAVFSDDIKKLDTKLVDPRNNEQ